jgi:hypothetical protein
MIINNSKTALLYKKDQLNLSKTKDKKLKKVAGLNRLHLSIRLMSR